MNNGKSFMSAQKLSTKYRMKRNHCPVSIYNIRFKFINPSCKTKRVVSCRPPIPVYCMPQFNKPTTDCINAIRRIFHMLSRILAFKPM